MNLFLLLSLPLFKYSNHSPDFFLVVRLQTSTSTCFILLIGSKFDLFAPLCENEGGKRLSSTIRGWAYGSDKNYMCLPLERALQNLGEFTVTERNELGVKVGQRTHYIAQGCKRLIDVLGLLHSHSLWLGLFCPLRSRQINQLHLGLGWVLFPSERILSESIYIDSQNSVASARILV